MYYLTSMVLIDSRKPTVYRHTIKCNLSFDTYVELLVIANRIKIYYNPLQIDSSELYKITKTKETKFKIGEIPREK